MTPRLPKGWLGTFIHGNAVMAASATANYCAAALLIAALGPGRWWLLGPVAAGDAVGLAVNFPLALRTGLLRDGGRGPRALLLRFLAVQALGWPAAYLAASAAVASGVGGLWVLAPVAAGDLAGYASSWLLSARLGLVGARA